MRAKTKFETRAAPYRLSSLAISLSVVPVVITSSIIPRCGHRPNARSRDELKMRFAHCDGVDLDVAGFGVKYLSAAKVDLNTVVSLVID